MYQKIFINESERIIVEKNGEIWKILEAGPHYINHLNFMNKYEFHKFSILNPVFNSPLSTIIKHNHREMFDKHFLSVDTSDTQIAIVYINNKAAQMVSPGSEVFFWKHFHQISVEYIDIKDHYEIPMEKIACISEKFSNDNNIVKVNVPVAHKGVLYIDGKFEKILEEGLYVFWSRNRKFSVQNVDMRVLQMEISGQEILTKDRLSIRVNFDLAYKVLNPRISEEYDHFQKQIYREAQLILRHILGQLTFDEILGTKENLSTIIFDMIKNNLAYLPVEIMTTGLRDIILPGDIREIMNKIVEAEKIAQANLIKRREEVAATRSLLNTAKMYEQNPTLMKLKEFDVLEKISEKVNSIEISGKIKDIFQQL